MSNVYDTKEQVGNRSGDGETPEQKVDTRGEEGHREEGRGDPLEGQEEGEEGYVYFMRTMDDRFIKIGYTIHPPRRNGELQSMSMERFGCGARMIGYFPAAPRTETWLQRKFRSIQEWGEWFRSAPELIAFIENLGVMPMKKKIDPEMSAAAAAMGRKGGPARAKALTKERRREIARKAAQKRWADEKAAK